MKRFSIVALTAMFAAMTLASPAAAQKSTRTGVGGGGSEHWTSEWTIKGAKLSVSYGRPMLKGRDEAKMMPAGKPWRTGADEATVLTTSRALMFGSVTLAPGSYTINTVPGDTAWMLVFGKLSKAGQWGIPYQAALELSRVPMKLGKTKANVEQLTIDIDRMKSGGLLRVEWGTKSASVPFTVAAK